MNLNFDDLFPTAKQQAEQPKPDPVDKVKTSFDEFTLEELPQHPTDFAQHWLNTQNPAESQKHLIEYQSYLQAFKELADGSLVIPDADGKALALEIKRIILQDFRHRGVIINIEENKAHRAFFAHCTKRVLDSLEFGKFSGPDGFVGQKPEISRIIKNRVNEIFVEKVLGS